MGIVPLPEALRDRIADPDFWTGSGLPATDDAELRVSFPVTAGYGLVLEIDLATGERTLGLRGPASSEPIQLGRADPSEPSPAALRWWELELCARVIALEDPTLPHPGLVVALLSPFAPATRDDDPAEIAAVREAAYRSLRREVPAAEPNVPEQTPLPLFASAEWWPEPPSASPQVLDEAAIATLTSPDAVHQEVRGGSRFPREDLQALVRHAAQRLSQHRHDDCYTASQPLAEHIAGTGDLRNIPQLLSALTEAGCDHPTVLDALSEPLVPIEACWMVETLAGAEPGTLLRHHV
jgi:hypothetical protein